jgi:hypothetical protein
MAKQAWGPEQKFLENISNHEFFFLLKLTDLSGTFSEVYTVFSAKISEIGIK